MLFKMPHKSKGSSSCFVSSTGYQQLHERLILSEFYLIDAVHSGQSLQGEEDTRGPRKHTTQRSGLLAAAQPIKKGGIAQSLLLVFKNVVCSWLEVVKAGPCSNFNLPYQSRKPVFFSFLCIHDMKRRKNPESDWSASFLAWSRRQCPHRRQHFVYSLTVMLCLFRWGTRQHTSTHRLTQFVGREGGGVKDGEEKVNEGILLLYVMYSKVLSACESQTHCVLQVPINSVL